MSTYACELYDEDGLLDDNCIIGFDEPMETFFFYSGKENELGVPLILVGQEHRAFRTIASLMIHFEEAGLNLEVLSEDMAELQKYDNFVLS